MEQAAETHAKPPPVRNVHKIEPIQPSGCLKLAPTISLGEINVAKRASATARLKIRTFMGVLRFLKRCRKISILNHFFISESSVGRKHEGFGFGLDNITTKYLRSFKQELLNDLLRLIIDNCDDSIRFQFFFR